MAIATGVPNDYLVPGHFAFVDYGGAFGPAGDLRRILIAGPKTSDGTATVNTVYTLQDDTHCDTLTGVGAFTAALGRALRVIYPTAPIDLVVTEDHASGVAATGTITPSGTATSAGTLTAKVCGREYTDTIAVGDTAEVICEKLNLLINPTKLEMAKRLANELKADYNLHRASAVFHTAADGVNIVAVPDATNLATLVTLANDIRSKYEAHRILVGGGPCHGQADNTNAVSAAVCTDLDTATVLLKDIKAQYEAHRINVSGAPPVHAAADTTNVIVSEDPVDETHPHLPLTSLVNPAGPQVDLTAKCKGPDGNHIRVRVSDDAGGITWTQLTNYELSSGANQADYSSAYAAALSTRYHYIAPVCNDSATLTAATVGIKDRLTAAEQALVGKRMKAIIGHNGTPSAGETLCDDCDYYRMEVASIQTDTPPWELGGAYTGLRSYQTSLDLSANISGEVITGVTPPEDAADYPTETELNNALHEGLALMSVNDAGQVIVTVPITTKHTDGAGHADLSVWSAHKVEVGDDIADTIISNAARKFVGFKLMPDPADPDTLIPQKTMTPANWSQFIYEEVKEYENDGHLAAGKCDELRASFHSEINGSNPNRIDYTYPFYVIDHFLTSSGVGEQVG